VYGDHTGRGWRAAHPVRVMQAAGRCP
jgi:hypothetical protein